MRIGGRFKTTMTAKDKSGGFDPTGSYKTVTPHERIEYVIDDGRKVSIMFERRDDATRVIETFEIEGEHTREQQREGWKSVLDNFKKYVETH